MDCSQCLGSNLLAWQSQESITSHSQWLRYLCWAQHNTHSWKTKTEPSQTSNLSFISNLSRSDLFPPPFFSLVSSDSHLCFFTSILSCFSLAERDQCRSALPFTLNWRWTSPERRQPLHPIPPQFGVTRGAPLCQYADESVPHRWLWWEAPPLCTVDALRESKAPPPPPLALIHINPLSQKLK